MDLAPHDDAAQALASTPSAPPQLLQVPEAGSAATKAADEAPSSDRGMPATGGTASAESSRAQHAAKASAGTEACGRVGHAPVGVFQVLHRMGSVLQVLHGMTPSLIFDDKHRCCLRAAKENV